MREIARTSAKDRNELFSQAANQKALIPSLIEKDFWVCWLLDILFEDDQIGPYLIFKGGTSLSKVFGIIDRFSEDVDLSVQRLYLGFDGPNDPQAHGLSATQRRARVEGLREACRTHVQTVMYPRIQHRLTQFLLPTSAAYSWGFETDPNDRNTLRFVYPTCLMHENTPYVAPVIKLEFGTGSDPEPVGVFPITPYVAEEIPAPFSRSQSTVIAQLAERTFWEKATLLHAEFHRREEEPSPPRFARHYSDLAKLANHPLGRTAVEDFEQLRRVAEFKSVYFKSSWAHYDTAVPGSFHLLPAAHRSAEIERDYTSMAEMFFTTPPPFTDVIAILKRLEVKINGTVAG